MGFPEDWTTDAHIDRACVAASLVNGREGGKGFVLFDVRECENESLVCQGSCARVLILLVCSSGLALET